MTPIKSKAPKQDVPGTLVWELEQEDGQILQEYEVEVMGQRCRYFHFAVFPEPPICRFTGNEINLN